MELETEEDLTKKCQKPVDSCIRIRERQNPLHFTMKVFTSSEDFFEEKDIVERASGIKFTTGCTLTSGSLESMIAEKNDAIFSRKKFSFSLSKSKVFTVPFIGHPFVSLEEGVYACEYGFDKGSKKPSGPKKIKSVKTTKKLQCSAMIIVKKLVIFTGVSVKRRTGHCMKVSHQDLQNRINLWRRKDGTVEEFITWTGAQFRFYAWFPNDEAHDVPHLNGTEENVREYLNQDVTEVLEQMIRMGARCPAELCRSLKPVLRGLLPEAFLPENVTRAKYWPDRIRVKDVLNRYVAKTTREGIDQEGLVAVLENIMVQDPGANVFYRPYVPRIPFGQNPTEEYSDEGEQTLLLVIQTSEMRQWYCLYGSHSVLLNPAHRHLKYPVPFYVLAVEMNGVLLPVALIFTQTERTHAVAEGLNVVLGWNEDVAPKFGFVSFADSEMHALTKAFKGVKVFVCDFHREQEWKRWTTYILKGRATEGLKMLTDIASEADPSLVPNKVESVSKWAKANSLALADYLQSTWNPQVKKWCAAFRPKDLYLKNTSSATERLNSQIKHSLSENTEKKLADIVNHIVFYDFQLDYSEAVEEHVDHTYESHELFSPEVKPLVEETREPSAWELREAKVKEKKLADARTRLLRALKGLEETSSLVNNYETLLVAERVVLNLGLKLKAQVPSVEVQDSEVKCETSVVKRKASPERPARSVAKRNKANRVANENGGKWGNYVAQTKAQIVPDATEGLGDDPEFIIYTEFSEDAAVAETAFSNEVVLQTVEPKSSDTEKEGSIKEVSLAPCSAEGSSSPTPSADATRRIRVRAGGNADYQQSCPAPKTKPETTEGTLLISIVNPTSSPEIGEGVDSPAHLTSTPRQTNDSSEKSALKPKVAGKAGRNSLGALLKELTEHVEMPPSLQPFKTSVEKIEKGQMLDYEAVGLVMKLLKKRFPKIGGLQDPALGKTFLSREDPSQPSFEPSSDCSFVQVVHTGTSRWVALYSDGPNCINILDCVRADGTLNLHIVKQGRALAGEQNLKNFTLTSCQQAEEADSGVVAVAHAVDVCCGIYSGDCDYDLKESRRHLLKCLYTDFISPFPRLKGQLSKRPDSVTVIVS